MGLLENYLHESEGIQASSLMSAQSLELSVTEEANFAAAESPVSFNINLDLNQLLDRIIGSIPNDRERGAWVQSLLDSLCSATNGVPNIMIFNRQQNCDFNPNWSATSYSEKYYQNILYGVWIFCGGERFVNQGDGGWINWGFYGSFDRDGGNVQFHGRGGCVKQ